MAKRFLIQAPWPGFFLDNEVFDLSHLKEYHLSAEDSDGNTREILVTFSDHCFTRKDPEEPLQSSKYLYRESARKPGYFCRRRYQHSLLLVEHIEAAKTGSVWNASGENFSIIPIVTDNGNPAHYAILFNLRKLSGLRPYHLRMDVASAYICDDISEFKTFGVMGFKKLVTMTMLGKRPSPNHSRNRKRPK